MMLDGEEEESDVEEASDVKKRIFRNVSVFRPCAGQDRFTYKAVLEGPPR